MPVDIDHLMTVAGEHRDRFRSAQPFPHVVLDGLFPDETLDAAVAEFPPIDDARWFRFDLDHEANKMTMPGPSNDGTASFPPPLASLFHELNGALFLRFLGELTGIDGLVPDPELRGGGLHQIGAGGHLDVHVDFNRHPITHLERRLNVLVYLNRDWDERWGGHLELWDPETSTCAHRVAPAFNRTVVFALSDRSLHGHPTPLRCPASTLRRSLALYYYAREAADDRTGARWETTWLDRSDPRSSRRWRAQVARIVPPVAIDAYRRVRRSRRP